MAKNIPIWQGSSSFFPGDTPFGLYDNDFEFQNDIDKVSDWCAKRLGYPLTDIELQDINLFACFEESVTEYSSQVNTYNIRDNMVNLFGAATGSNLTQQKVSSNLGGLIELAKEYGTEAGSGGNVTYYTGSLAVTANKQIYDLTDTSVISLESGTPGVDAIELKKVLHEAPPAITRFFDPYIGAGAGSDQMLDGFDWGSYSPGVQFMLMPIYADVLRMQGIEFNDQIRKSAYSFQILNNRIQIWPIPNGNTFTKIYFQYIKIADRSNPLKGKTGTISDFSNVPYDNMVYSNINDVGKQWIRKYTLALAKEMLGAVREKYSTVPIPGSEVSLDGAALRAEAQTEKDNLIEQLRENLNEVSKKTRMENEAAMVDQQQTVMQKVPLAIYVG